MNYAVTITAPNILVDSKVAAVGDVVTLPIAAALRLVESAGGQWVEPTMGKARDFHAQLTVLSRESGIEAIAELMGVAPAPVEAPSGPSGASPAPSSTVAPLPAPAAPAAAEAPAPAPAPAEAPSVTSGASPAPSSTVAPSPAPVAAASKPGPYAK